jgi:hypothetical protein
MSKSTMSKKLEKIAMMEIIPQHSGNFWKNFYRRKSAKGECRFYLYHTFIDAIYESVAWKW